MNTKITISLVVVLVLAVAALLLTRGDITATNGTDASNTPPEDANANLLISTDALGVGLKRVTFDGGVQGTMLQLERIEGRWWVTAPNRFAAKTKAVDELLTQLSAMKGRPTKEGERGGLVRDSPGLLLEHGDQETNLFFSDRLGAGRAVVTVNQGDTFQDINTTDTLIDIFESLNPDTFYHDRFDPPLMPEVGRIEITTPEGTSALEQEDGRWWIDTEINRDRALETSLPGYPGLKDYFDLFKTAKLIEKQSSSPANGLASFGLKDPLISVRFIPLGQSQYDPSNSYEVHVGTPADPQDQTRYVSSGSSGEATYPVFTMNSQTALAFAQDATAFRDPRILVTPPSLIESMSLRLDEVPIKDQLIRFPDQGNPELIAPSDQPASEPIALSQASCAKMLKQLAGARAIEFVELTTRAYGLIASVNVKPKLDGEIEEFSVFHDPQSTEDNPTVLVQHEGEKILLRIKRETVASLIDPSSLLAEDEQ